MPRTSADLRIEDVSRASGVTVRSIRAYQSQGLLPPPRLRGRLGLYDREHLARLRAIVRLHGRGFSLAAIRELLTAAERGETLEDVLGLAPVSRPQGRPGAAHTHEDAWLEGLFDGLPPQLPPVLDGHLLHPN